MNTQETEIERLRSDLREYKDRALYWSGQSRMKDAEIKRLKNVIQDTASKLLSEVSEETGK